MLLRLLQSTAKPAKTALLPIISISPESEHQRIGACQCGYNGYAELRADAVRGAASSVLLTLARSPTRSFARRNYILDLEPRISPDKDVLRDRHEKVEERAEHAVSIVWTLLGS